MGGLISQMSAVTLLNLRAIPQRSGNSLVIVIGIAGVVAVLTSVLSVTHGFRRTIENSAHDDRAIVLTRGAEAEAASSLPRAAVSAIENAPGIRRNADGRPLISAEVAVMAPVARKKDGSDAFVTLRGVGSEVFGVRQELKLLAGRMLRSGVREVLVGRSAQKEFSGLEIGNSVRLGDGDWTVVGVFGSDGNSHESSLIADAGTLMSAYRLKSFNSVTVLLDSERSFEELRSALRGSSTLLADARREREYFASLSQPFNRMLNLVAYAIGGIMAIGALFGAVNTMYFAVRARTTEIATLRALGFASAAVVVSVLVEALLLALLGALVGMALVYVCFDGRTISTIGNTIGNNPQLVYSLSITSGLVATGVSLACFIGLIGGLWPAIRAARMPVATALHNRRL